MNLGILIRQQREKNNNMTLRELDSKIGMAHSQIANYETGKTGLKDKVAIEILVKGFDIAYSKAKDMVAEFKIQEANNELSDEKRHEIIKRSVKEWKEDWIASKKLSTIGIKTEKLNQELMREFNLNLFGVEDPSFLDDDKNWIPVYANIADGYTKTPPKPIDEYPIPRTFKQYTQDQLFYATATDNSMSPKIDKNDLILILRDDFILEDGKLYIFKEDNAYIVRKYEKITEDIAQLVAENQNYPKITITKEKQIECVGKVLRIQKEID